MPYELDSTGELRADEQSSPASFAVKKFDVRSPKVDKSKKSIDIYIWSRKKEWVSDFWPKLAKKNYSRRNSTEKRETHIKQKKTPRIRKAQQKPIS